MHPAGHAVQDVEERRPDPERIWRRRRLVLLALIVAWAAALRAPLLLGPFGSGWQHLGALYCDIARNFLRYGLLATRFAAVTNADVAPRPEWVFYMHHPPGMGLMTAAAASVVGEGPLAIRLPCLLFSLLQVVVTYLLVSRALSPRAGLAAAFATAVLPAGASCATIGSDLGPPALALALLALWLDQRARDRDPARPRAAAPLLALAASLFFDWPALLIAVAIAARDALARRRRRAALFAAVVPATFAVQAAHVAWATGSFSGGRGGSLVDSLRVHGVEGAASLFSAHPASDIVRRVTSHLLHLFTPAGLALAALGGALALGGAMLRRNAAPRAAKPAAAATFAGLATLALGYSLPFTGAVAVHRFWLIVALPAVAFLIGYAVHATGSGRVARVAWGAAAVVLGALSSRTVVAAELAERTPYFEEFGTLLRGHVPSGTRVLTTERATECLDFYAQRELHGEKSDADLAGFVANGGGNPERVFERTAVAILDPSIDPAHVSAVHLREWLAARFPEETLPLPRTGTTLHLFDLTRTVAVTSDR